MDGSSNKPNGFISVHFYVLKCAFYWLKASTLAARSKQDIASHHLQWAAKCDLITTGIKTVWLIEARGVRVYSREGFKDMQGAKWDDHDTLHVGFFSFKSLLG